MWASVQIKTAGALPLSVEGLRNRLRIDGTAEDALLGDFLAAAASRVEGPDGAGLALMAQTWTLTLDAWADEIPLPGWPVTGVTEIRYLDVDGAAQVLDHAAAFRLVKGDYPARLVRKPGVARPAMLSGPGVIEIDYTLGRDEADEVDAGLVTALALLAGHYYENREATAPGQVRELPLGVEHILARFTRGMVA